MSLRFQGDAGLLRRAGGEDGREGGKGGRGPEAPAGTGPCCCPLPLRKQQKRAAAGAPQAEPHGAGPSPGTVRRRGAACHALGPLCPPRTACVPGPEAGGPHALRPPAPPRGRRSAWEALVSGATVLVPMARGPRGRQPTNEPGAPDLGGGSQQRPAAMGKAGGRGPKAGAGAPGPPDPTTDPGSTLKVPCRGSGGLGAPVRQVSRPGGAPRSP